MVTVFAPAKLNLFLEVLGKRTDGFHEIETLMVPVSLCDTLAFQPGSDGAIHCALPLALPAHGTSAHKPARPPGGQYLAVRAARRLREAAGIDAGATMQLVKRVPMEAGLAGGSSDAAAALVAA